MSTSEERVLVTGRPRRRGQLGRVDLHEGKEGGVVEALRGRPVASFDAGPYVDHRMAAQGGVVDAREAAAAGPEDFKDELANAEDRPVSLGVIFQIYSSWG